jgi:hypothetical protein
MRGDDEVCSLVTFWRDAGFYKNKKSLAPETLVEALDLTRVRRQNLFTMSLLICHHSLQHVSSPHHVSVLRRLDHIFRKNFSKCSSSQLASTCVHAKNSTRVNDDTLSQKTPGTKILFPSFFFVPVPVWPVTLLRDVSWTSVPEILVAQSDVVVWMSGQRDLEHRLADYLHKQRRSLLKTPRDHLFFVRTQLPESRDRRGLCRELVRLRRDGSRLSVPPPKCGRTRQWRR